MDISDTEREREKIETTKAALVLVKARNENRVTFTVVDDEFKLHPEFQKFHVELTGVKRADIEPLGLGVGVIGDGIDSTIKYTAIASSYLAIAVNGELTQWMEDYVAKYGLA